MSSIIDNLLKKRWVLVDDQPHPLASLRNKNLGPYKLVILLGPKNRFGASYFQILLKTGSGEVSQPSVVMGLHNQGRFPSYNWIEISMFASLLKFSPSGKVLEITRDQTLRLFQHLADLIPPGGHMMIEYESPEHRETARSLALGIPPVVTPLGYMLFLIGCGVGFRDWYFAEGGTEGPRKLQGFKALNPQHAQLKASQTIQELTAFLNQPPPTGATDLEKSARNRAQAVLKKLGQTERR